MTPVDFLDPLHAESFIKTRFAENPARLEHILVVADRVRQSTRDINELNPSLNLDESLAYCAALVHDIGYLEEAMKTGFHPLDGRNFLAAQGYARLGQLIVGHSSAPEEARLLGLPEIALADDIIADLITYWDVQVKQGGATVTYDQRLADILHRYGADSVIGKANLHAEPRIRAILRRIDTLLQREAI